MAVYIVTGKLGNGKSLVAVGRIREKLQAGCMVATNLNIRLDRMMGPANTTARLIRVPDKPLADDLYALGNGNPSYDEEKNGLLVLDECGTWFNSRNWQDKTRKAVNDWFLHSRKLGWDVILIVQDVDLIDSQARAAIAEHTCFCKRLDRLHVPFFGTVYKILTLGETLRLPRIHVGKVVYGITEADPLTDRWVYRGTDLFACYDTKQSFLEDYPHGLHSILPGWHVRGRYQLPRTWRFYMRMTRIMWKRFKSPFALVVGLIFGAAASGSLVYAAQRQLPANEQAAPAPMPSEPENVEVEKPPASLLEQYRDLRIVGSLKGRYNGEEKFIYQFSHAQRGESPQALVTSTELQAAGIGVKYFSECKALLTYQGNDQVVYCL